VLNPVAGYGFNKQVICKRTNEKYYESVIRIEVASGSVMLDTIYFD
jgi:hypothetical protein